MAKRGYRGKHPYNDMKVAATEVGKSAKLSKVTKEYNKTNSKYKYDFIKSHDGFFPQATAKLTFGGTSTNAKICTITSTDGTSKAYVAAAAQDLTTDPAKWASGTSAAANAVNLVDIGTEADDDGFVDGISAAINSTGFKGFFPCNGVLGMSGGATTAATETADEVQVVVSGTAGAGGVVALKFFGLSSDSPTA